jgi:2-keto-4-pentenoate hydratase/2-oxohepta-3-ene-1,7-dioic acid hydratase in catechol pathway
MLKLFSFSIENEIGIGIEASESRWNLTEALNIYQQAKGIKPPVNFSFLQVLVEMGYCSGEMLMQILEDPWVQSKKGQLELEKDVRIELPIPRPSKIFGIGQNYKAHAKELNHQLPTELLFFSKAPSSLIRHENVIVIPQWMNDRVDHEAELALVIGKEAKNVLKDEAMSYLAGYTIANDVTARSMQKQDMENRHPWYRSKSFDTFCPLGPYLVPADEIPDPDKLEIQLTVNGETRQKAKTSDMIFKVPEIISHISKFMTLNPGDIIATGTPEGVSPIQDDDVIEITISGLGTLRNHVKKEG